MNELALQDKKDARLDETIKKMWDRPSGKFAKVTKWLAIGGIGYAFYLALPALIAFMTNIFILFGYIAALGVIGFILTNKDIRRWGQLLWLQLNRKVYGFFVKIDPIAILENGIREMKEKLQLVTDSVTKLESSLVAIKERKENYEAEKKRLLKEKPVIEKKLSEAGGMGTVEGYALQRKLDLVNNDLVRSEDKCERQGKRIEKLEKYLKIMKILEEEAKFQVKDSESQLRDKKEEYEDAKQELTAIGTVQAIFKNGFNKSIEEEMALDVVNSTINASIAEMNRLIDGSNDILANFMIETEVNSALADEIMAKYTLDTPGKEKILTPIMVAAQQTQYQEAEVVDVTPSAKKYF